MRLQGSQWAFGVKMTSDQRHFGTKCPLGCSTRTIKYFVFFRSGASVRRCLFRALKAYCSEEAREFFQVVFDLELAPSLLYAGCEDYVEGKYKSHG